MHFAHDCKHAFLHFMKNNVDVHRRICILIRNIHIDVLHLHLENSLCNIIIIVLQTYIYIHNFSKQSLFLG